MNVQIVKKSVKHIYLKVKPNGEVVITAPIDCSQKDIDYVLQKRSGWIEKRLAFYSDNKIEHSKEYVSGENFCYLGKNYRLKVIESEKECVKLQKDFIELYLPDKNDYNLKQKLIKNWYKEEAQKQFEKAVKRYLTIVKREVKTVRVREMKSRWGSCNPDKGYINLNIKLIEKPLVCIEYVVFHELAHLVHPNHGKDFYNFLTLFMPDWRERKKRLECH